MAATIIVPVRPPKRAAEVAQLSRIASNYADAANNPAFGLGLRADYQRMAEAFFQFAAEEANRE